MTNLDTIFQTIETLTSEELDQVYQYIRQRRQTTTWTVNQRNIHELGAVLENVHQEADSMTDDEIDSLIDNALDEVRSERKGD
jgi:hypothetical protein